MNTHKLPKNLFMKNSSLFMVIRVFFKKSFGVRSSTPQRHSFNSPNSPTKEHYTLVY